MNAKKDWIAFGIGVSAGAALAVLYAPHSGEHTRRQLRKSVADAEDYLGNTSDYLKEQAERLTSEAHHAVNRTRKEVETAVDRAGELVAGMLKTAQSLV